MMIRTTIYLDESVLARIRRLIPPRGLSQLINELLLERIMQLEQAALEAQMREGYQATRQERRAVSQDWQLIDGESWPA